MRPISKCLNSKLSQICMRAIQLEELSTIVLKFLPQAVSAHCQVSSFRSGILVLITSSPLWATQLRYLAPELRERLRTEANLYQIITVQIKLQPELTTLRHHSL